MKTIKKLFVITLFVLVFAGIAKSTSIVSAQTYYNTASGVEYTTTIPDFVAIPGETLHVKLPVKAIGHFIQEPKLHIETENMPYTISNLTYNDDNVKTIGISTTGSTNIEFDIKFKETATIGKYKLKISVEFFGMDGDTFDKVTVVKDLPPVYIVIDKEKEAAQLTVDNISFPNAIKGKETTLSFTIKNEGELITKNTYFSIDGFEAAGVVPMYSKLTQSVGTNGELAADGTHHVKLPIEILSKATSGTKTLTINFTYKDVDGKALTDSAKIYINIEENESAPIIEIESVKFANELKAGDKFNVVVTLRNVGESTANNIKITMDGLGVSSFIQNFTTESINGGDLDTNQKVDIKIPLIVSNEASKGLKKVDIKVAYEDDGEVAYSTSTNSYINVTENEKEVEKENKPNVVINNVSQNPSNPTAGGSVDVSFDIMNKSKTAVSEVKVSLGNLSANSFLPENLEPYQYIETIKAGEKVRLTIPLSIANTIQEGMGSIEVKLQYKDENYAVITDSATIYVLDIENVQITGKPKLLISNFGTDVEELRAGSVFIFNYDIKNTHQSIAATNIKITVSQAENIFSVTSGSNTSYITKIGPGEIVTNSIELKVKSDAATKTYPIDISIEYEYEGVEANPTTGQIGETVKEVINLQAIEDSRPVVNNIYVGYGDIPFVNQSAPLTFEFYNMGKSALNNVRASIEGDFILTTGSMYFIGNVAPGSSEYAEMEATPTVEGISKGILKITFEDSNGDEVTITKEFESSVQSDMPIDMGNEYMPGPDIPMESTAKKAILPIWLFIVIQVAILAIGIPVTRVICLKLHRRKLRKQENSETI